MGRLVEDVLARRGGPAESKAGNEKSSPSAPRSMTNRQNDDHIP